MSLTPDTQNALRAIAVDPKATLNERDAAHSLLHSPNGQYTGAWRASVEVLKGYAARQQEQDRYGK